VSDEEGRVEAEKRAAAEAAAGLVEDGMGVGLGTGSTVAYLLPALAARGLAIRCVATSPATEARARELGLAVEEFDALERLDVAIDGADQVTPDRWLVKGGGGALLREKVVAAAARRFTVIVDSRKPVSELHPPLPLELFAFGAPATAARLSDLGEVTMRGAAPSPDGGLIADLACDMSDPERLAARLDAEPGVAGHGLFAPRLVSDVLVGGR
jgi:ribose 5-phosphate isomerase A